MSDQKDNEALRQAIQEFIDGGGTYEEAVAALKAIYGPGAEKVDDDPQSTMH